MGNLFKYLWNDNYHGITLSEKSGLSMTKNALNKFITKVVTIQNNY